MRTLKAKLVTAGPAPSMTPGTLKELGKRRANIDKYLGQIDKELYVWNAKRSAAGLDPQDQKALVEMNKALTTFKAAWERAAMTHE